MKWTWEKTTAMETPRLPHLGKAIVDSDLLPHDTFLVRQGDVGSMSLFVGISMQTSRTLRKWMVNKPLVVVLNGS